MRFLTGLHVQLADDTTQSWVTITRTGTFHDPRYGEFSIELSMLEQMVRNFSAGAFGQDVFIDVEHDRKPGAAGRIQRLAVEGNRLRALVEWTKFGIEAIRDRGFRYLSAEFHDNWVDNETRQAHGPLLMGAALTTRPVIKRLDPVELSNEFTPPDARVLLHPELIRQLSEKARSAKMKWLEQLKKKLTELGLADAVVKQLCEAAQAAAKHVGEDEKALTELAASFESTGKSLADSIGDKAVELSINIPGGGEGADPGKAPAKALTEEQVEEMVARKLADAEKKAEDQRKKLAEDLESRRKVFTDAVEEAKGLDDATKKELAEQVEDLITAGMTDEQCRKLAEFQIAQAHKLHAARQLASMGYNDSRTGSPVITLDDANNVKQLTEEIRSKLKLSPQAASGQLRLVEKEPPFVQRVLAEFDQLNASRLARERRIMLADGEVDTGRTDLPVSFQREVIREALSDLRVLELVQTLTDFGATATTQIPYEERDDVNDILNDGIVFEGQPIPNSGIEQKSDLAYILPMKLALKLTNEVIHFTRASQINWDAWARNIESNARHMRELIARRIANELQRVADSFQAVAVANENVGAQLDGSESIITLAEFPVVRPFQQKDLKGNNVGDEENPITVTVGGDPAPRWDGSGTQDAGTYWRPYNFNLGKIQLVDEAGDPVTPDTTGAVSYSHATNVGKFDLKLPAETRLEVHLNGAHRAIGARKALMRSERFVEPNFLLMSPVLNDTLTNAEQHAAQSRRSGSDTDPQGDLERVKGVDAWGTNAPSIDLGDQRVIMGIRGQLSYVQAKPFQIEGQAFEAVDSQGRPTGQKVAYGEEYSAIHVPVPLRGRMTSVLLYDSDDR